MRFIRRHDAGPAGAWWQAVAQYPAGAPGIVRELLLSGSVTCDPAEAEQALAWARAHPAWIEDPAPLVMEDPDGVTLGVERVQRRRIIRPRRWAAPCDRLAGLD